MMTMEQDRIPTPPPQEYAPQWLESDPPPPARFQQRLQFEEKSRMDELFDNKLSILAIGIIIGAVLAMMRPVVIHAK